MEILTDARKALTSEQETCYAGRLLEELKKLLGGAEKNGAGVEGQKKEDQGGNDEEETENTDR